MIFIDLCKNASLIDNQTNIILSTQQVRHSESGKLSIIHICVQMKRRVRSSKNSIHIMRSKRRRIPQVEIPQTSRIDLEVTVENRIRFQMNITIKCKYTIKSTAFPSNIPRTDADSDAGSLVNRIGLTHTIQCDIRTRESDFGSTGDTQGTDRHRAIISENSNRFVHLKCNIISKGSCKQYLIVIFDSLFSRSEIFIETTIFIVLSVDGNSHQAIFVIINVDKFVFNHAVGVFKIPVAAGTGGVDGGGDVGVGQAGDLGDEELTLFVARKITGVKHDVTVFGEVFADACPTGRIIRNRFAVDYFAAQGEVTGITVGNDVQCTVFHIGIFIQIVVDLIQTIFAVLKDQHIGIFTQRINDFLRVFHAGVDDNQFTHLFRLNLESLGVKRFTLIIRTHIVNDRIRSDVVCTEIHVISIVNIGKSTVNNTVNINIIRRFNVSGIARFGFILRRRIFRRSVLRRFFSRLTRLFSSLIRRLLLRLCLRLRGGNDISGTCRIVQYTIFQLEDVYQFFLDFFHKSTSQTIYYLLLFF